ncbi:MAG: selenium-dependent molybdenum cofactor biosynthesis protein YqeB [Actinobacteria bacterium]|nr:selenium-dependent molybdenum cofactor biosynthesis protein YqeB [Actinomycetota bacterium]
MPGEPLALIRGAGDLASGVALRLHRAGFGVVMTEIPQPAVVRRTVAFAEAVYEGRTEVEGLEGILVQGAREALAAIEAGRIPVVVDPTAEIRHELPLNLLVDAILAKRNLGTTRDHAPAVVALGPGFVAGRDVHAVVETMRGHTLGRVIYQGEALPNTGVPGEVGGKGAERVLRAPAAGRFAARRRIGDRGAEGEVVGTVAGQPVVSAIDGILRGLVREGLEVTEGFKVGDVDPRACREHCFTVSDKALAVAGGVLEAACFLLGGVRFGADGHDGGGGS